MSSAKNEALISHHCWQNTSALPRHKVSELLWKWLQRTEGTCSAWLASPSLPAQTRCRIGACTTNTRSEGGWITDRKQLSCEWLITPYAQSHCERFIKTFYFLIKSCHVIFFSRARGGKFKFPSDNWIAVASSSFSCSRRCCVRALVFNFSVVNLETPECIMPWTMKASSFRLTRSFHPLFSHLWSLTCDVTAQKLLINEITTGAALKDN